MSIFDELDLAEKEGKNKPRKKKPVFNNALEDTSRAKTAKAAGRTTHQGNLWARTIRLPPEYQDVILKIYQNEPRAKSIADIERWIFAKGLEAYFVHGERPAYAESLAREIELPIFEQ
ncbi:MAG: hypothetical protein HUU01_23370 [Saprospiraceae bacterium]|nr:hypothetical protein [Saprospiraceae bacterium]